MAAIEAKASAWLRTFKDNYAALDPWLKRSIIYSAKTFPNDEKKFWLKFVKKGANDLEKIIIDSIK
ncbi:hypothetical protein [Zhaonella formicivorans]|uniref:hypothetical protein n=1 Tax=Zhaonella formicivorans TaxID=2528593 RepID=UPI0010E2DF21|nr:hypothetical protein [Zhaonella formicivorans]